MSFLSNILAATRERIAEAKRFVPPEEMRRRALARRTAPRGFLAALRQDGIRVIAEIKRASPSKGAIDLNLDPAALAVRYEQGGAAALSVLTEPDFFKGSLADLESARRATSLPVLRKDFIIDPYQVYETAAAGADAMLLIIRAVDEPSLHELYELARSLGLDVLIEAYDEADARRAQALGARVVGINARDLTTFQVDLSRFASIARLLGPQVLTVALSGIQTPADIGRVGCPRVLVGESLVRNPSLLPMLIGTGRVKVCGLMDSGTAHLCGELGFGAVGAVFYPPSPRNVTAAQAADLFRGLPPTVARVGVFVNEMPEAMIAVGRAAGLTTIQCHGSEPLADLLCVQKAGFRVVKAVKLPAPTLPDSVGMLVECGKGSLPGGNGAAWDWASAAPLAAGRPIALAGGLTPQNLAAAARASQAAAFDISSGVELAPGVKSPELLRQLAAEARKLPPVSKVFNFL